MISIADCLVFFAYFFFSHLHKKENLFTQSNQIFRILCKLRIIRKL